MEGRRGTFLGRGLPGWGPKVQCCGQVARGGVQPRQCPSPPRVSSAATSTSEEDTLGHPSVFGWFAWVGLVVASAIARADVASPTTDLVGETEREQVLFLSPGRKVRRVGLMSPETSGSLGRAAAWGRGVPYSPLLFWGTCQPLGQGLGTWRWGGTRCCERSPGFRLRWLLRKAHSWGQGTVRGWRGSHILCSPTFNLEIISNF